MARAGQFRFYLQLLSVFIEKKNFSSVVVSTGYTYY